MAVKLKYSNNSGKTINVFVPEGMYFFVKCPDAEFFGWNNITGLEPVVYNPGNQMIIFSKEKKELEEYRENSIPFLELDGGKTLEEIFYSEKGKTIIFTPKDNNPEGKSQIGHGFIVLNEFYDGENKETGNGRKTRSLLEKFSSLPLL